MKTYSPTYNFPGRKVKGLIKLFQGISAMWYWTDQVVREGQPMKPTTTLDKMLPAAAGKNEGAKVMGLALQETYDESAFGQLKGYHFANDTRQRLDGMPIGLLMGEGWAATNNYWGTVAVGDQAAIGASGRLIKFVSGTTADGDALPVVFEGSGTNGATLVRIRYAFPMDARA